MPTQPPIASLLALALIAGAGTATPALGAIFKCRSANGLWVYADHPPAGCHSAPIALPLPRFVHPPGAHADIRRPPDPAPAASRKDLRKRLQRDEATLRALRATPVPRDPALARWRRTALKAVTVDIATTRRDLQSR
ncbi:hypothetical protein [Acidiferrobacter sp.]|uniref:hypothetical protein n=1 Tax=Acidiferrobacter sp. TaxID=1872107 RepID=UPI0026019D66|nr:hypothetical protein [Acidiferrobacter sp.]